MSSRRARLAFCCIAIAMSASCIAFAAVGTPGTMINVIAREGDAANAELIRDSAGKKQVVGAIDWGRRYYYATGEGAMLGTGAKAYLAAKTFAKLQAIAHLQMAMRGTTIDFEATGRDFVGDERIAQQVKGFLRSVGVVRSGERKLGRDQIVWMVVRAPMMENGGQPNPLISAALQGKAEKTAPKVEVRQARKAVSSARGNHSSGARNAYPPRQNTYTSLIVDARGFNVARAISPKIRRPDGSELWGTVKIDPDELQERGIVAYARTLEEAKANKRAGSNPLIVKAIGRAGGKRMCDVVLSEDDCALCLTANAAADPPFLDSLNVIFVVDPMKLF